MLDNSIKKGTTLEQARNSVKFCRDSGIRVGGFFVLGMPGETKNSIEKTFTFARELNLDYYAFSVATAYPGTELYENAIKNGKIHKDSYSLDGSDWIADVTANFTDDIETEELRQYQNKAFTEFVLKKQFGNRYYLHPAFIKKGIKIVTSIRNKEEARKLYKKIKKLIS